mgnify:CR=1 FL=1
MAFIQHFQPVRKCNFDCGQPRKFAGAAKQSSLSLMIDPTDIAHHLHQHAAVHHNPTSTLDALSTFTLAKASIIPNQSLAPLPDTVQPNNMVELIPDLPAMPGGAPRSGNPFLAESFRELYSAALKSTPQPPSLAGVQPDGSMVIPARELDVIARYADLLNRIPLAAAVYALIDFFLINAEEDMAIIELLDEDEEVEALMEVENRVVMQRFVGLFVVVIVTVGWSLLTYHPVPFNEL